MELGRFDWCVMDYTPGCVTLLGSDDPDNPYTLIDLASGEKTAVQRSFLLPIFTPRRSCRRPREGRRTTTPVMSLC